MNRYQIMQTCVQKACGQTGKFRLLLEIYQERISSFLVRVLRFSPHALVRRSQLCVLLISNGKYINGKATLHSFPFKALFMQQFTKPKLFHFSTVCMSRNEAPEKFGEHSRSQCCSWLPLEQFLRLFRALSRASNLDIRTKTREPIC